jgi:hypothetical protein
VDLHRQIAAWIAIAIGALVLLALAWILWIFGSIAALIGTEGTVVRFFASIGLVLAAFIAVLALAVVGAGAAYLRGSSVGRWGLIVSNLLFLFAFPVGTVIGIYSLWAFLRPPTLPQVEVDERVSGV